MARPTSKASPQVRGTQTVAVGKEIDSGCSSAAASMMSEQVRADVLVRLRRISGQVEGIARMVDSDRYCVDVLQQLSAINSSIESVSKVVVRNYLERCVTDAINGGDPLIYDELMRVVFKHR